MKLETIIREKINFSNEAISFREFMQMALYYPNLGYYAGAKDKISAQGDFITATSRSSLFARVFAKHFSDVIEYLGDDCCIIEFGAGTGKFAIDCINELYSLNTLPNKYVIIELSNDLKLRQQKYIKDRAPHLFEKFIWLKELPSEKLKAIVFANEVLDAMPVDVFRSEGNRLIQQGVKFLDDKFEYVDLGENDSRFNYEEQRLLDDGLVFKAGYTSEVNTWIRPWIKSLRDVIEVGVVFLCDYGYHRDLYYSRERTMGTLACYHKHQVNFDPFINIGEQDITAHVDFTTVAEAVTENGFDIEGYITQANFLKRSGISEVFSKVCKSLSSKDQLKYSNDMKDLLLGDKLGDIFKVFGFSIGFDPILEVFDNEDNIDYLL